jgi:outer membrane lipoprotein-sorting protein
MKNYKLLLYLSIAFLVVSCNKPNSSTNADSTAKEMATEISGMKTAMLEYKTSMKAEGITSISSMKQWMDLKKDKLRVETETTTEMNGSNTTMQSIMINTDGFSYIINPQTNTAIKMNSSENDDNPAEMIKSEDEKTFRQMIEAEGGKVIANEEFLGRNCIVIEMVDEGRTTKAWYYKGIVLKMTNDYYSMEATKFEENISIPANKFEIPSNITITEMPTMPEM